MLYRPFTSAILVLINTALSTAQSATSQIPNTLPACAQACTALTQASQSCASNQATYQSCFCQSALLTSLKTSSTNNVCAPQCGDTDFATIASWYNGQCGTSAAGAPTTTPVTLLTVTISNAGSTPTSATATATTTDDAPSSATSDPGLPPNDAAPSNPQAWFSTHYQWVIMLIVLAIGLVLFAILLTWLRKRQARRREAAENAGPHPAMEHWAPNQRSIHDVGNFGAAPVAETRPDTAKGKEPELAAVGRGTGSRKLKKSLFRSSQS